MKIEPSDYELWLASPVTKAFFAFIATIKQANLEALATTDDDEKEGYKIKGEIRNQNFLLDLNNGDAHVRLETPRK